MLFEASFQLNEESGSLCLKLAALGLEKNKESSIVNTDNVL